jgi:nucleotide-binding universal stress UspA family protein
MFARLLVGLDGGVRADVALEQAIVLARRFGSTVTVACVREPGSPVDPALAERGRFRATGAGVRGELIERDGSAATELAELGKRADAILIGRPRSAVGRTTTALVRGAARCVVVCGGAPSPMRVCAAVVNGGETSSRALRLAARVAAASGGALHLVHAAPDEGAAQRVTGPAEAMLSHEGVAFDTHVRAGNLAVVVPELARELRADVLFVGADPASSAEDILARVTIPVVVHP